MASKVQTFKLPAQPQEPPLLRLEPFKGMNLSVTPTQIDKSQSPDMLNMNIDERGALNKRTGYERVFPNSLGPGQINGLYEYRKLDGTVLFLLAHGTKLYTQSGNEQPVQIYDGLENAPVDFFTMNGDCYLLDGTNYLVFDGIEVKAVEPYIPTLSISREPAGGGEPYEDFNLLGSGFIDSFSTLGTDTVFQLSLSGLDATPVEASWNGGVTYDKVEGKDFTVDRALGKVTFTKAPDKGTNNVLIKAFKTYSFLPGRIKKCRFHTSFGGSNDTRIFVSGNPEFPNEIWRSGLFDPTYFPENGNYIFPSAVKGFAKQYDYLVVEHEYGKQMVEFEVGDVEASFPSRPINDQVGTIASNSIQLIENNPVSLSKNGVYRLIASNVRDERNVEHISENIDAKLLQEPNLEDAVSIDYNKKYWLALNGNVYIYDYSIGEWYIYDNIHASFFIERNRELYFGSSKEGILYRFKKPTELFPYNDDGHFINAYWKSAKISFGIAERNKLIQKLFATMEPGMHTSCNFYYVNDKVRFPRNKDNLPDYSNMHYAKSFYNDKIFDAKSEFINSARTEWLDYADWNYSLFSYNTKEQPMVIAKKVKAKKVDYYQLVIQNTKQDEGLKIDSLSLKYLIQSYRK
ncbi:hypothetical protein [Bacillus sp. FJAT-49736]|uniref:hypothetical protein n=1 Tax=Bacillus sp. FJAT-49736 TaxID=2833582 RepID=UPI001BC8FF42|nr:hypothetical protein [Bacillus sp. FJAT-49736]MBS4173471.1 hypothetical protein [Bacillus sp. FJAT-49736]